jgi:activating signal cointegrator 1
MKCLSVAQPWASLLVLGNKQFETRPWQTAYRGPVVVHASKALSAAARALCSQAPFRSLLAAAGIADWSELPLGRVVGGVEVVDCVRVEDLAEVPDVETRLGDFSPGRWAWRLARPVRLAVPLPARGRLGLFELEIPSPWEIA